MVNIKNDEKGISLVELNISIAVLGVLLIIILGVFANYFVIITRNSIYQDMNVKSQGLLRTLTEELRYGAGVRVTNTIDDPNNAATPPNEWNTNNEAFVVVTAVPAVDINNEYIINADTGAPYFNEFVYYQVGSTMYKRALANPAAAGNRLVTSCPENLATESCPRDVKLIDDVNQMNFVLYDQDDAQTTDPLLARSVVINLSLSRETFGEAINQDNSVRTTLRNYFQ